MTYLMGRVTTLRYKPQRWQYPVMPKPMKKLDKEVERSATWLPKWADDELFQVKHMNFEHSFVVNISKRSCSCNFCELVGISCRHVVVALSRRDQNPEDFVVHWYTREQYELCFNFGVSPVNGQDMWLEVECEEPMPPQYKRGPNRPKKLRRREPDEHTNNTNKFVREETSYRCTKCDKYDNNARSCKSQTTNPTAKVRKV